MLGSVCAQLDPELAISRNGVRARACPDWSGVRDKLLESVPLELALAVTSWSLGAHSDDKQKTRIAQEEGRRRRRIRGAKEGRKECAAPLLKYLANWEKQNVYMSTYHVLISCFWKLPSPFGVCLWNWLFALDIAIRWNYGTTQMNYHSVEIVVWMLSIF